MLRATTEPNEALQTTINMEIRVHNLLRKKSSTQLTKNKAQNFNVYRTANGQQ